MSSQAKTTSRPLPSASADPGAAERYALTHGGTPGDVDFYVRACREAGRVLELGCGAARVSGALGAHGKLVVGLDIDRALLSLARKQSGDAVRLVRGDMREFAFGTCFDRICIPHSGLYALLDEADCARCLRAVADHLAPDGRLVFDAYAADHFHADADPAHVESDEPEYVTRIEQAGRALAVYERCRWQRRQQRLDVHYEYVPLEGGASLHAVVPQRYWLRSQVEPLLARCGLAIESFAADFEGASFGDSDEALVVVARRAER